MVERNGFDCLEKENSWENANPFSQLSLQVWRNEWIRWNLWWRSESTKPGFVMKTELWCILTATLEIKTKLHHKAAEPCFSGLFPKYNIWITLIFIYSLLFLPKEKNRRMERKEGERKQTKICLDQFVFSVGFGVNWGIMKKHCWFNTFWNSF